MGCLTRVDKGVIWEVAQDNTMQYSNTLKKLPYEDSKIAVLFSGGMGSFLSAYILKIQGYQDVTLYFNDTMTEDDDLYRFLVECHDWLGYPLVYDADGRDVFQVFIDEQYMGNTRKDVCSKNLKRLRRARWAARTKPNYLALGIDPWEVDRLHRANDNREKAISKYMGLDRSPEQTSNFISKSPRFVSPLVDAECFDVDTLKQEALEAVGTHQPVSYDLGFGHNNCSNFCVKAGLAHYKNLWEKTPEKYLYFEGKEQEVYDAVPGAKPFLKKTVDSELTYITLRQYRQQYLEPAQQAPAAEQLSIFSGLDMSPTSCMSCALAA